MTVYRIRAGSCYGIEEVTGSCVPKYFSMNWNRHGASLWKGMKWLLYAEIVAIGAGYYVWHKMNVSEEYRKQMYEKHPYVLEDCAIKLYTTRIRPRYVGFAQRFLQNWRVWWN
ncbi:uncharacterized protein [Apostichopus japonicus]|uniref:uncharacterized protein isoform X2 n=1 Tax=Stichopus japonicus TaxID=307972 RepID=UPI003AB2F442